MQRETGGINFNWEIQLKLISIGKWAKYKKKRISVQKNRVNKREEQCGAFELL